MQVNDALYGPEALTGSPSARLGAIRDARSCLTTPSADLAQVCALAGLDMATVIERMKDRIAVAPRPDELVEQGIIASRPAAPRPPRRSNRKPFKHEPITWNGMTLTGVQWATHIGGSTNTLRGAPPSTQDQR